MIIRADARALPLKDESVQMCVTSPPYFAQRDYGVARQIGLERTVVEYINVIREVLGEIHRVLKPDGILFLNLGDCHYSSGRGRWRGDAHRWEKSELQCHNRGNATMVRPNRMPQEGLKDKDLIGIPWRVALAAQADGWWLRSDIVWSKTACMPESITDRPTRSHEYIFLLTKSGRYFYNADAIREPHTYNGGIGEHHRNVDLSGKWMPPGQKSPHNGLRKPRVKTAGPGPHLAGRRQAPEPGEPNAFHPLGRNKRTVWTINPQPFPGSHFATFPEEIPRLCILAGSLPLGADEPDDFIMTPIGEGDREPDPTFLTGRAGFDRPRRRIEGSRAMTRMEQAAYAEQLRVSLYRTDMEKEAGGETTFDHYGRTDRSGARAIPPLLLDAWIERGWLTEVNIPPRKAHYTRSVVLDPFGGSGTTSKVALELGRKPVHIDLTYHDLARKRMTTTPAMAGLM